MSTQKLHQIILFFIFIFFLSCDGELNISPASFIEDEPKNEACEEVDHLQIGYKYSDEYFYLLKIAENMRSYVDETLPNSITLRNGQQVCAANKQIFGREDVEVLTTQALQLVNGQKELDGFLCDLLDLRFKYLVARDNILNKILKGKKLEGTIQPIMPLPTNKKLFGWLVQSNTFSNQIKELKKQRRFEIGRFEFLNWLIKETFLRCNLADLSTKTTHLLRASIQLHPILAGIDQDLGHPDEACGAYYKLLTNMILLDTSQDDQSILVEIKKKAIQMAKDENLIQQDRIRFLRLLYQLTKLEEKKKEENKEEKKKELKQFLYTIKKNTDVKVYKAHFMPKSTFIRLMGLGTPANHGINKILTDYETNKWIDELPEPEFLKIVLPTPTKIDNSKIGKSSSRKKKKKKRGNTKAIMSHPSSSSEQEEDKHSECISNISNSLEPNIKSLPQPTIVHISLIKDDQEGRVEVISPIQSVKKEKGKERIEEEEKEESFDDSVTGQTDEQYKRDKPKQKKKSSLTFIKKETHLGEVEETISWPFDEFCPLPRWVRIFHSKAAWTPCLGPKKISNKHQEIIDDLFDPSKQCNVTYKQFKTVFEAAGGTIKGTDGSHRALVDSNKKKIPGIDIFVHGNGQTFGKDFIKNLQIAVLYIGLRPSWKLGNQEE
jgi:hypothetical protein